MGGDGTLDDVLAHVLLWDQVRQGTCSRVSDTDPAALSAVAMAASRASLAEPMTMNAERQAFLLMPLRHSLTDGARGRSFTYLEGGRGTPRTPSEASGAASTPPSAAPYSS